MPIDYDDMMQSGATGLAAAYDEKDVMLYALGVGFGRDPMDGKELPFVYENDGLKVPPTFASVISRGEAPPERQRMPQKSEINFLMVVDGERRITMHKPLPPKPPSPRAKMEEMMVKSFSPVAFSRTTRS